MPPDDALIRTAPAKINLGLHVLRRRADGYHDVETVLLRIGWADRLTAEPADVLAFTCSDPSLPTGADNLCVQAARRLASAFGVVDGGARLHLEKRLPHGAGLGGGSSNAAHTLRLLAALWDLDAPAERLHDIAGGIGADVPFFLHEAPAALATGRGDVLQPLLDENGDPYRLPFALVVVAPGVSVSTAEAYHRVQPHETNRPDLAALVRAGDLARWRAELTNDFAPVVFSQHPEIEAVRDLLADAGAGYSALTGSGGAVFGVFEDESAAAAAAEAARQSGHRVFHQPPA